MQGAVNVLVPTSASVTSAIVNTLDDCGGASGFIGLDSLGGGSGPGNIFSAEEEDVQQGQAG